jgi:hypothetical protein
MKSQKYINNVNKIVVPQTDNILMTKINKLEQDNERLNKLVASLMTKIESIELSISQPIAKEIIKSNKVKEIKKPIIKSIEVEPIVKEIVKSIEVKPIDNTVHLTPKQASELRLKNKMKNKINRTKTIEVIGNDEIAHLDAEQEDDPFKDYVIDFNVPDDKDVEKRNIENVKKRKSKEKELLKLQEEYAIQILQNEKERIKRWNKSGELHQ